MPGTTYVLVMLGVIALIGVLVVPALIRKRCAKCGARNSLDAKTCVKCDAPFPDD
ncbi:MAG: hypothetical protein K1Y02_00900 [Candidatus Hydrogenedentes bacterium]|nr:hypothetical protein [Candidatus Hydrogenedentota bacterium]